MGIGMWVCGCTWMLRRHTFVLLFVVCALRLIGVSLFRQMSSISVLLRFCFMYVIDVSPTKQLNKSGNCKVEIEKWRTAKARDQPPNMKKPGETVRISKSEFTKNGDETKQIYLFALPKGAKA